MNAKKRANFLKQMPECNKVCIIMATPFNACVERDEKRDRHVGVAVLEKMRKNFQMPYYNEGWDHIEVYYPKDCDMIDPNVHFDIEINFNQQNHHHRLTVGDHEALAENIASERGYGSTVQTAAAYHDCGKIWCQVFKDGDKDAHYYNHESVSAYQFLTMETAQMLYALYSERQVIEIAALITWHMVPYSLSKDCSYDDLKEWARAKCFDDDFTVDLWHLHECDIAAH